MPGRGNQCDTLYEIVFQSWLRSNTQNKHTHTINNMSNLELLQEISDALEEVLKRRT